MPDGSDEPRQPGEVSVKGSAVSPPERSRRMWALGVLLLASSIALPATTLKVPFLPLTAAWKARAIAALVVAGEIAFWVAALVPGRETVRRYRRFFDPRNWLGEKRR